MWDYIFLDTPPPKGSKIPIAMLDKLKNEFNYWYPVDLRVSGKVGRPGLYTVLALVDEPDIWPLYGLRTC